MRASGVVDAVHQFGILARGLQLGETFLLHCLDNRSENLLRGSGRDLLGSGSGSVNNHFDEVSHGASSLLMGNLFGNFGVEIVFVNIAGRSSGAELHVRDTLKSDDGEHPVLGLLNVLSLVIPRFSDAGDAKETVLGSSDGEGRDGSLEVSSSVGVHFAVIASQDGSHGDQTLNLFGVTFGVL